VTPLDKLEAFVLEHYSHCLTWEDGVVKDWLLWAFSKGFLFLVVGKDGNPIGMTIARPLAKRTDSKTDYQPDAENIYVDLEIATCKPAFKLLMAQMVNHFGVRKNFCFQRYNKPEKLKVYDFRKLSLKILRS
jgi:hypothetical protein